AARLALGLMRARRLARAADIACAVSVEALQGSRTSFLPQIHELRPLRGQKTAAANVLRLLEGSAIIEAHRWCDKVQDAYSLRCAPQVHGACRDLLDYAEYTVGVELNAATDNPLVLVDEEELVSMGNAAGLKAWQVLANSERALAIELLAGAQAVEFHAPLEPGAGGRAARAAVRRLSPRLRDDRPLAGDIEAMARAICDGSFVAAVEADAGALE